MALTCIICEIKQDWTKIVIISYLPLHSMPPFRRFRSEYCHPMWYGKTRMVGLPDGENYEEMCNRLDTVPACDRQTDGPTDILTRHSSRYAYASRGNKNNTSLTLAGLRKKQPKTEIQTNMKHFMSILCALVT